MKFSLLFGNFSRRVYLDVSKGVIESYQRETVKILSAGGAKWVKAEHKATPEQMCLDGNFFRVPQLAF